MAQYSDDQLREMALAKAVMASDDGEPERVVQRAELYYKFMKGEEESDGQE